jgi:hypothetical protein
MNKKFKKKTEEAIVGKVPPQSLISFKKISSLPNYNKKINVQKIKKN